MKKYKALEIDFKIPEDLQDMIDQYVKYLNESDHTSIDYYETEIKMILNWCYRETLLTDDQIELLRDYYENGEILKAKEKQAKTTIKNKLR